MGEDFKVTVKDASESKVVSTQPQAPAPPIPVEQPDSAKKLQKKGGND